MHASASPFRLISNMKPAGDQIAAIAKLTQAYAQGTSKQILLGVTGSGKTFTMAHVLANLGLPTLVMAPNKTLAAQLYEEFKGLFPHNAVEYFVSYYDYYQPEAYVPTTDTYIAKDSTINDAIDRMRHAATQSLLERNDVIIVASVSCIYGLGSAEAYHDQLVFLQAGEPSHRDKTLRKLIEIQYKRNEIEFSRGHFRVRGDVVEIFPVHEENHAIRIEFFGDTVESIARIDPLTGTLINTLDKIAIYPATHYTVSPEIKQLALQSIRQELQSTLHSLRTQNKLLEAQRLEQRTLFDLEMIEQMGFCNGIENYSRHLTRSAPGAPPPTLLNYFPKQFLLMIDESHQTVPQIGAMYRGDRSRKETLVNHGFRLPSALDNRPLQFAEFLSHLNKVMYVSATPGNYELEDCDGVVVEQIIRPTGLLDPEVEVRSARNQVDDLLHEAKKTIQKGFAVLVTTLTKRMAEDLTEYFNESGILVRYLHSDIDTLERVEIIEALRRGVFNVLVGINLLREGLDIPEVALVGILDADKEGFLRSSKSLIQTIGRAARNREGRVILYGDKITPSMQAALDETNRRRKIQMKHNRKHGITPTTTTRAIRTMSTPPPETALPARKMSTSTKTPPKQTFTNLQPENQQKLLAQLQQQMKQAAKELNFEAAAKLRDKIALLQKSEKS